MDAGDIQFHLSLLLLVALAAAILIPMRRQAARAAREQREKAEREATDPKNRPPPQPGRHVHRIRSVAASQVPRRAPFVDHDNVTHEVGERWTFLFKAFLPYEDGLSLVVERNGEQVHIRLQCRDDAQGPIVRSFWRFVVEE
jgi:hypothetical protein